MPVNKVRRRGSYAPLSAHAYKDDALARAGEAAELLYYRGLSFAADVINDGYISDVQLDRFPGAGMTDAPHRAQQLVEHGLWLREDGGYRIRSWLQWNRSRAEIELMQVRDAARKINPAPDGEGDTYRSDSDRSPNGQVRMDSDRQQHGSPNGFQPRARTPEPDTEPEPKAKPESAARTRAGSASRKRPATPLPADWTPTTTHRAFATEHGLDLQREIFRFRSHAEANDRRQASWAAAFTSWLDKARDFAPPPPAGGEDWRRWSEQ